jgi:hypothetical protein
MKRTIIIASCLTVLGLAVLFILVCLKRTEQGGALVPERTVSNDQANNVSSPPSEKPATVQAVFEFPVHVASLGDGQFCPCYIDLSKNILYAWKGVVLRIGQVPDAYDGVPSGIKILNAKDFTVVPVAALVKYREFDGGYRPGYLDGSVQAFYEWKGVVLTKQQVLDKSQDGQTAIVDASKFSQVIEIDMPTYLKDHPGLWKKS